MARLRSSTGVGSFWHGMRLLEDPDASSSPTYSPNAAILLKYKDFVTGKSLSHYRDVFYVANSRCDVVFLKNKECR